MRFIFYDYSTKTQLYRQIRQGYQWRRVVARQRTVKSDDIIDSAFIYFTDDYNSIL